MNPEHGVQHDTQHDTQHDKAIWLLSDGRSGSTWLAQLLNFNRRFHVEHEPVHCDFNPRLLDQPLLPFPDDASVQSHYLPLFEDMLAGRYVSHRFGEEENCRGGGLLIRDINAMLIAPRVLAVFPQLRPAILVRHPAEVAVSKVALSHWNWFGDIERYLENKAVRREMTGLGHLILAANTPYRRHVIHWAASHRYFFSEVMPRSLPIIRYPGNREDICIGLDRVLGQFGQQAATGSEAFDTAWRTRSATGLACNEKSLFHRVFSRERPSKSDLLFTEKVIDAFCLRWLVPWTAYADAPAAEDDFASAFAGMARAPRRERMPLREMATLREPVALGC